MKNVHNFFRNNLLCYNLILSSSNQTYWSMIVLSQLSIIQVTIITYCNTHNTTLNQLKSSNIILLNIENKPYLNFQAFWVVPNTKCHRKWRLISTNISIKQHR